MKTPAYFHLAITLLASATGADAQSTINPTAKFAHGANTGWLNLRPSAADGVVVSIQNGGPYGLHTIVAHASGISTMYAHQSGTAVRVGQTVARGQVIGYVGSSGWVTGPHLHWEVHVNGVPYNPLGWFGGPESVIACYNQI